MLRKILLLICFAFVVVCYGYPCFILPFGQYEYSYEAAGITVTSSYSFGFDGKVKIKLAELESESFYKLKGNKIVISEDDKFEDSDMELKLASMYSIGNYTNKIGMFSTIGLGVLALVLIITIPSKK